MLTMTCDGCGEVVLKEQDHYGVDFVKNAFPELPAIDDDEEAELQYAQLIELGSAHEFHFCSTTCLTSWAMAHALDGTGET